jgi:hypothetical protein
MGRRIAARAADTIVIGQYEIDVDVLEQVLSPNNRVLWAFVKKGDKIQPFCVDESRCIWLLESDLDKADCEIL